MQNGFSIGPINNGHTICTSHITNKVIGSCVSSTGQSELANLIMHTPSLYGFIIMTLISVKIHQDRYVAY